MTNGGLTPVERHAGHLVKRDDLFEVAGIAGGKVRTCAWLARDAVGLVTAGARHSPQIAIVARVARHMGIPAICVTAPGQDTPEIVDAVQHGAEIIRAKVGYTNVISARAREVAEDHGWTLIPFGMEHVAAVEQTSSQVVNVIASGAQRIVAPVGSGMSLAGILAGLGAAGSTLPVLGVVVGADPTKRLDRFASGWRDRATLVPAGVPYEKSVYVRWDDLRLDPIYEAKCARFVEPSDLLWIVGIRATVGRPSEMRA